MPDPYWTCDECRRVYGRNVLKHFIDVETSTSYHATMGGDSIPYRTVERRTICTTCLRTLNERKAR